MAVRSFAAAGRLPHQYPVGRAITGAAKTAGIDESFREVNRMAIESVPVRGQRARDEAQNVGRQMWNPYPRQNEKASVVSDKANIPPPRRWAPAYITIAAAQMARRRTPRQTGDRPALRPHQIFEMLADRLLVGQVMMMFYQAVEQGFVGGLSNLLQRDWADVAERSREWRHVNEHPRRAFALHKRVS